MNADEWALENAARLVAHVERHGLTMTWSEAQDQLRRCAHFLEIPAYVDDGEGGLLTLGAATSAWGRPDFTEEVASGYVLDHGRPFFPVDPSSSRTGVAIPWGLAGELVMRLSALLTERVRAAATAPDIQVLVDLSVLVVNLSSRVSEEMTWLEEDGERSVIADGEPYLLMRAQDAWQAAALLREARGSSPTHDAGPVRGVDEAVGSYLVDEQATDAFLWDLDWWLTDRNEHL